MCWDFILKLACNNVLFGIGHLTMYHLCGDNLDKGIKQRYMRIDNEKPASIHYFHSFAVANSKRMEIVALRG